MKRKPSQFKQKGPQDQMMVTLMSLEGGLENIRDGIQTDVEDLLKRMEDLRELLQYLPERW